MKRIDHTPCITDQEVILRIMSDQKIIKEMKDQGYPIVSNVSWQSPTTLECHCIPIFRTDSMEDICNRYYDFWPKECMLAVKEVEAINASLHSSTGMSKMRTMMSIGRIPVGLQKLLDIWSGGDFFPVNNPVQLRKNMNKFFSYFSKLKIGVPYGQTQFKSAGIPQDK